MLLDECVPRRLRRELSGHDVRTVSDMGWSGTKNGELLRRAATEFDVLFTVDQNSPYQQNLEGFDIALLIVTVSKNDIVQLRSKLPAALAAIEISPAR